MSPPNQENEAETFTLKALPRKLWNKVVEIASRAKELGSEDPRRVFHALKVGLALTLVSLFYYFKPLYDGFGVNAMWAVLTVVVVLEFSVGATLGKGSNRMLATLVAGALGIGAHRLANLSGESGEPILIAIFVFITAAISTFTRFFPLIKARYDYGLAVFILTFCLVSVSGYRESQVIEMAHMRLSTIVIGSCTAIVVCVGIYPVWIGEELHNLVTDNIEKLGIFLEGFGRMYFEASKDEPTKYDKTTLEQYKSILNSKGKEEIMANLAYWEPAHGQFRFCHPWKQYLKIGDLTREYAYKIEVLNNYLDSEIQTPLEIRKKFEEPCKKVSQESGKALMELATATKKMERTTSADMHIANSKPAAEIIAILLKIKVWKDYVLLDIIPVASAASVLLEIVESTEKIAEAVHELASMAHFKNIPTALPEEGNLLHRGTVQPILNTDEKNHIVSIQE